MSTADSTQKRPDMLMSDRTVLKRKSTDHSEARNEEEGRERIKKGMKTEVRGPWFERAKESGPQLNDSLSIGESREAIASRFRPGALSERWNLAFSE